jgi:hypothetical protein
MTASPNEPGSDPLLFRGRPGHATGHALPVGAAQTEHLPRARAPLEGEPPQRRTASADRESAATAFPNHRCPDRARGHHYADGLAGGSGRCAAHARSQGPRLRLGIRSPETQRWRRSPKDGSRAHRRRRLRPTTTPAILRWTRPEHEVHATLFSPRICTDLRATTGEARGAPPAHSPSAVIHPRRLSNRRPSVHDGTAVGARPATDARWPSCSCSMRSRSQGTS